MTTRAHVVERLLRTLVSLTLCGPPLVGACDDAESRVADGAAAKGGRAGLGASAGTAGGPQGNGATSNGGAAAGGGMAGSVGGGAGGGETGVGGGGIAGASGGAATGGDAGAGGTAGMAGNAGNTAASAGMAGNAGNGGTAGTGANAGKGGSAGTGGTAGMAGNAGTGGAGFAGVGGGIAGGGAGGATSGCSSGETAQVGTTCFLPDGTSVETWLLSGAAGPWHLHCTELERQPGSPCPPSASVCTVDTCDFHSISATGDPKVEGDSCCYATTVCMGGAGGCGRPLIVNAVVRIASLARRADWR